jgi:hypothetical protein
MSPDLQQKVKTRQTLLEQRLIYRASLNKTRI